MNKSILALNLILSIAYTAFSQNNPQNSNNNGQGYVTYYKVEGSKTKSDMGMFNLIKLNPLLIINGDLPVYYERRIKDNLSIEISAGITLKDYIFDLFYVDPDYNYYIQEVTERRQLVGYSGSVGFRFYPSASTSALEGFFFGPEARYRRYKSEALRCEAPANSLFKDDFIEEYRQVIDFRLTFGYISYITERVFFEWYNGVGVRTRDISRAYCDTSRNPAETILLTQQDLRPIFSLGVKLGFAF